MFGQLAGISTLYKAADDFTAALWVLHHFHNKVNCYHMFFVKEENTVKYLLFDIYHLNDE